MHLKLDNINFYSTKELKYILRSLWCKCEDTLCISRSNPVPIEDTGFLFDISTEIKTLDISKLNLSNVKRLSDTFIRNKADRIIASNIKLCSSGIGFMFYGCASKSIDISNMISDNVIYASAMFENCKNLVSIDISNAHTQSVLDMSRMFRVCQKLSEINLTNFRTDSAVDMEDMFKKCDSLKHLDLSSFDTRNVKSMQNMFYGCSSLEEIVLHSFNTDNVTDFSNMFAECKSLRKICIPNFTANSAVNICRMFYGCSSLEEIDLSNFSIRQGLTYSMFSGCKKLRRVVLPKDPSSRVIITQLDQDGILCAVD